MRFVSYSSCGVEGVGLRANDGYHGLSVEALGADLKGHLADAGGLARLAETLAAAPPLDPSAITLLPPVPRPDKILCVGLNYADHSVESGFTPPDYPTVFARFASSLVGAGAPLVRPNASEMFDYEAELVVVIGRGGRHIREADALAHVAGYSLGNDGSVRDYQKKSPQWTMGKNWDASGAFGPELVTPDELPEGCRGLQLTMHVNGIELQRGSTDDMIFDVATLIATLSEVMTLAPGDVIFSGTPAGVGQARTPPRWLQPGDECVVALDGLGRLANPVVQEGA